PSANDAAVHIPAGASLVQAPRMRSAASRGTASASPRRSAARSAAALASTLEPRRSAIEKASAPASGATQTSLSTVPIGPPSGATVRTVDGSTGADLGDRRARGLEVGGALHAHGLRLLGDALDHAPERGPGADLHEEAHPVLDHALDR